MANNKHLTHTLPLLALLTLIPLLPSCSSQRATTSATTEPANIYADSLAIMSYNVENLFDPDDNPLKDDDEFTPDGIYHWNEYRFRKKCAQLGQVITLINGKDIPDIIGLCEVEGPDTTGISAATLLVRYANLPLTPVCFPTPDNRGIATALLFNPYTVEPLTLTHISASSDSLDLHTRDILYAKMRTLRRKKTFHILVNHWPSKRGGTERSTPLRNYVAQRARHVCDSILATDNNARIILLGDFNDIAIEPSLTDFLGAQPNCDTCLLRNLSADTPDFSYKYHGRWSTIDHIIVSPAVCENGRPRFSVYKPDFLLEPDDRNTGFKPKRTYIGRRYNEGGISDHLPVLIKFPL